MFDCSFVGDDRETVTAVINEGIDAWLEGFTRSTFSDDGHRLTCDIDDTEVPLFMRRLSERAESGDSTADSLLDAIVDVGYGYETV